MRRARHLFLPRLSLDASSQTPLHVQLREQLATALRTADAADSTLPSTRSLAALLGVSRNTVLAAYDELRADGLIHSRRGVGMAITPRARIAITEPQRLLRDAHYPSRTVETLDPDGTVIVLGE